MQPVSLKLALLTGGMLTAIPCEAQTGQPATESQLEDIVVTATRREERLQRVPISVTALSSRTLEASGVVGTSQLGQVTPGLVFAKSGAQVQFTIRGVGSRAALMGDESNIAVYVDGVYQPVPFSASFDLPEISRIEVLRGPQGTLFGRNATGGLINVITPDPSFDAKGSIQARIGSFRERSGKAYLSGGLSDKLAADISAIVNDDAGYYRDIRTDERKGDRASYSIRSKLLFQPSDTFSVMLTGNFTHTRDEGSVSSAPIAGNTAGARVAGVLIPLRPRDIALSFDPVAIIDQRGASLRMRLDLDSVGIESLTSYQYSRLKSLTDADASSANLTAIDSVQPDTAISQEFRASSQGSSVLQWTVGAFGFQDKARYDPLTVLGLNGVTVQTVTARNRTQSLAVFAEGTYSFTDALRLLLGGRYSWEERRFDISVVSARPGTLARTASFEQFTPRASLQYEFSSDTNAYVTYSRGFKSGLFATTGLNPTPVQPEKLDAYEVGLKSDPLSWLRVNVSAFYYDYKDIQVSVRDPNSALTLLQNAGRSRHYGGELEMQAAPARGLQLRAAVALLSAKFKKFDQALITRPLPGGGNANGTANVAGNDLIRSPHYTINLGADYTRQLGTMNVGASVNFYRSGRFTWEFSERLTQKPYTQINGQLFIEPAEKLRLGVFLENLTDNVVAEAVISSAAADYAVYNRPRSVGVFGQVKF